MDIETMAPVDDLEVLFDEGEDESLGDALTYTCTRQASGCG